MSCMYSFLSSLAQDFIEDGKTADTPCSPDIPELSSSGLHWGVEVHDSAQTVEYDS